MWTLVSFFLGVVVGWVVLVLGAWYVLSFFFLNSKDQKEEESERVKSLKGLESSTFQLPPVLADKVSDESYKAQESCWALNFLLQFLFRELRDSEGIRRWILRKLSMEFEELLSTTALGRFFNGISIHNIEIGQNFPILSSLKTVKVELHPENKNIVILDILVEVDYAGGFNFSIQAETHLRHAAFLKISFNGVKGQVRLQFTTEPYGHWSICFTDNPEIDISVVSQLYGKSSSHITSIITSQLKRSVRKKHTLPMYKIRYKPFFARVEPILAALVPNCSPKVETKGDLTVIVNECKGLMSTLLVGKMYATTAVGDYDWVAAYSDVNNGAVFVIRDFVYVKTVKREMNLDFTLAMKNGFPTVEGLTGTDGVSNSAAKKNLEFIVGDEILSVDGKAVTSVKQCIKNFKYSASMKVLWRIRRKYHFHNTKEADSNAKATENNGSTEKKQIGDTDCVEDSNAFTDFVVLEKPEPDNVKASRNSLPTSIGLGESSLDGASASIPAERKGSKIIEPETIASAGSIHYFTANENDGENACRVFRTTDTPTSRDPVFMESCTYKVQESHRFLNVQVWSTGDSRIAEKSASASPTSSPNKRSKNSIATLETINFGGNRLVGTLSIPLVDILAECSTTGMGHFERDYYLQPPDENATEAKELALSGYSGFEKQMCYGKITLSFLFKSSDEPVASKGKEPNGSQQAPLALATGSNTSIEVAMDALSESNPSPTDEFQAHQFMRTNFRIATACDYCNKKIWLKDAVACRICYMKCHKKCHDRCVANTICRGEGFYPVIPSLRTSVATPEIITTSDSAENIAAQCLNNSGAENFDSINPPQHEGGLRKRTLGGLIASAVQHRSSQLNIRRVGSTTSLLSPNQSGSVTRSLPPTPKASPTVARKSSSPSLQDINPFEACLTSASSEEDFNIDTALAQLIQNPNDDWVPMAKATGREVYSNLPLAERKQKLNNALNRLQEEIDQMSAKVQLLREELSSSSTSQRPTIFEKINQGEEKIQALALLMLLYCSGLQQVQDLEDIEVEIQVVVKDEGEKVQSNTTTMENDEQFVEPRNVNVIDTSMERKPTEVSEPGGTKN